jgi:hypothetical protein
VSQIGDYRKSVTGVKGGEGEALGGRRERKERVDGLGYESGWRVEW